MIAWEAPCLCSAFKLMGQARPCPPDQRASRAAQLFPTSLDFDQPL